MRGDWIGFAYEIFAPPEKLRGGDLASCVRRPLNRASSHIVPPRALFFRRFVFATFLLPLLFSLIGCASIERTVTPERDTSALREVFVVKNLHDNRRLAENLVVALRARGLVADSGPLTLLPPSAEAVVRYDDRWTWDFGDHMTYLRVALHDPGEVRPYATATRTKFVARSTNLEEALPPVLAELFAPVPAKRR